MENDIVPCEIPERLTVTLASDDIRALLKIHEYLYADEEKNYHALPAEERDTHVFPAVERLYLMLENVLYAGPLAPKVGPFAYVRSTDGCDEVFEICGPDGFRFFLPFWERENEACRAAITIVDALNTFHAATHNQKMQP